MDFIYTTLSVRFLLYFLTVTSCAFLAYFYINNAWIILATISFSWFALVEKNAARGILLTLMIVILSLFLVDLLPKNIFVLSSFLFIVIFSGMLIIARWREDSYLIFLILLFNLLALSAPNKPTLLMASGILIGALIVIVWQVIFLGKLQNKLRANFIIGLHQLRNLSMDLFACFQLANYREQFYLYERRIHLAKINFLHNLGQFKWRVNQLRDAKDQHNWQNIADQLERFFDHLLAVATLRWRVSDTTIFELCQDEMRDIEKSLTTIFSMLKKSRTKQFTDEINQFEQRIAALEALYERVLQVSAKEPFAFLLFIKQLKHLPKAMQNFYENGYETCRFK